MKKPKVTVLRSRHGESRIKPLYLMCEDGITSEHMDAVRKGIDEILRTAGVEEKIVVKDFGLWREKNYRDGEHLTKWNSVDWYLKESTGIEVPKGKVNVAHFINLLFAEPWREQTPHYDVVVVRQDLFASQAGFVIGGAVRGIGTVISVNRFLQLSSELQHQCITTETLHEVGHVFGLLPGDRIESVQFLLGKHCACRCVMRQGMNVPRDWIAMTKDRLQHGSFCKICRSDLVRFFK